MAVAGEPLTEADGGGQLLGRALAVLALATLVGDPAHGHRAVHPGQLAQRAERRRLAGHRNAHRIR